MVDFVEVALLVSSAFFATLSFGLLYRYRQVSQRITESSDFGRDLWQTLEQRLKKQDERIIDLMARVEVVQARVLSPTRQTAPETVQVEPAKPEPQTEAPSPAVVDVESVTEPGDAGELRPVAQQVESHEEAAEKPLLKLDATHKAAIQSLANGPLSTIEILKALTAAVEVESREHAARVMKQLFEKGLVTRDDSNKPFVYSLTDEGRRYL